MLIAATSCVLHGHKTVVLYVYLPNESSLDLIDHNWYQIYTYWMTLMINTIPKTWYGLGHWASYFWCYCIFHRIIFYNFVCLLKFWCKGQTSNNFYANHSYPLIYLKSTLYIDWTSYKLDFLQTFKWLELVSTNGNLWKARLDTHLRNNGVSARL